MLTDYTCTLNRGQVFLRWSFQNFIYWANHTPFESYGDKKKSFNPRILHSPQEGIFDPPQEGGHQRSKDFISPPLLATDGHRDGGRIRQGWSLQWSLNQTLNNGHLLLICRCKPPLKGLDVLPECPSISLCCGLEFLCFDTDCHSLVDVVQVLLCGRFSRFPECTLRKKDQAPNLPDKASLSRPLTALANLHRDHFDQCLFSNTVERCSSEIHWEIHWEIQFRNTVDKQIVKPIDCSHKLDQSLTWENV